MFKGGGSAVIGVEMDEYGTSPKEFFRTAEPLYRSAIGIAKWRARNGSGQDI